MPGPHRTPPDDDGFEVVDDPVPPKSKPSPKPPAGKPPVAKLLPPKPGQPARSRPAPADAGFEVVDDDPPPPPRKKPAAADSGFEVVDDDPPPVRKRKPAPPADDFDVVDDDEPQTNKKTKLNRALTDDTEVDDDEERPRKKKKTGKRGNYTDREREELERDKQDESNEFMLVAGISLIGFLFLMIGAYRLSGGDDFVGAISRGLFMGLVMVYILIKVPLTIVGLMVIGQLFGIEYGTIGKAVRNLFAVNLIADGIFFLGDSLPVPGFLVFIVGIGVTFGVFQTLFKLDPQETWTTLIGLNVLSFLFKLFLIIVVVGFLFAATRRANRDAGPMDNGNNPGMVDPGGDDLDDDEEDDPRPKGRRGR